MLIVLHRGLELMMVVEFSSAVSAATVFYPFPYIYETFVHNQIHIHMIYEYIVLSSMI